VLLLAATATMAWAAPPPPPNPLAVDAVARLRSVTQAEPDATRRQAVLREGAVGLPRGLYPPILSLLAPISPGSADLDIARAIFLRWAWETPDYAARWAAASPPEPFRLEAMIVAGGRWAQVDRPRAELWIASLPPADRDHVAKGVEAFLGQLKPNQDRANGP